MTTIKNTKTFKLLLLLALLSISLLQAQTTTYSKSSNSSIEGEWQEMRHIVNIKKGVFFTVEGDTFKMKDQTFKIISSNTFNQDEKSTVSVYCLSKDELGRMTKIVVFQYGSYYRVSILQRDVEFNKNYYTVIYAIKKTN